MPSELFDSLLELALDVAKKGKREKPPVTPPPRIDPMLKFAKVPNKAKDALLDVLDDDADFRERVLAKADERTVGRVGMSFLERDDGWEDFVAKMIAAAEEPSVSAQAASDRKVERRLEVVERERDRAEVLLAQVQTTLEGQVVAAEAVLRERDELAQTVARLTSDNETLAEQRQRAVSELKRTEEVMARHVVERKRLEAQVDDMTAAQLATSAHGGAVTDEMVRASVDDLELLLSAVQGRLSELRAAATPQRVAVDRRVALPLPPGLFDDSVEVAEYLLAVPGVVFLVDGYNVTREAHDEWELDHQRTWLEQALVALAARRTATFDVVFDGADISSAGQGGRNRGVRIRFSPDGVEADDVLIDSVDAVASERPVVVVSSDKRVRSGATERGANVLHSRQLLALMN